MNIRSVTYLAIIVAGMGASLVLPFTEMIGCSLSVLFLALFQPYFGWKKTLKIDLAMFIVMLPLILPTLLGMNQWSNDILNNTLTQMLTAKELLAMGFVRNVFSSPLIYVLELFSGFGQRTMMIWSTQKVLRRVGFYRIFAF
jgi:hypothetical protein